MDSSSSTLRWENDIPAAIFVWDERIKEEGLELLKEASANGLKVTIVTKDSGTKLETLNDHPIRKVASAKEKMDIVQAIEKNKKRVLYLGYGRNDIPALSAASGSMMVENGDPYALPYSDAVVTKDGLKLLVGEWLRFKKARSIAKYITLTASIQAVIILLLTLTRTLNPWLATLLTGITGTVMMVQTLRVEK
jgi:P-type Cu2+ transporter